MNSTVHVVQTANKFVGLRLEFTTKKDKFLAISLISHNFKVRLVSQQGAHHVVVELLSLSFVLVLSVCLFVW